MDNLGSSGKFCSAVRLSDGTMVLAYFSNGGLVINESYPDGDDVGWSRTVVDDEGIVGEYPSVAVSPDDTVYVAYYDLTNTALKVARETPTGWSIVTVESDGDSGKFASCAAAPDGSAGIIYLSYPDGVTEPVLRYAQWEDDDWQIETVPTLNVDPESPLSLEYAPDGNPAMVYHQLSPSVPIYVILGEGGYDSTVIDDTADCGGHPCLCFTPDGKPSVSYHVGYNPSTDTYNDLRYAELELSGWTHEDVWSGTADHEDLGYFSSLKYDSKGRAGISYYEQERTGVEYAYRTASGWTVEQPQTILLVGLYSNLIFDDEDRPNIFYYDMGHTKLRRACGTDIVHIDKIEIAGDGTGDVLIHFSNQPDRKFDMYYADATPSLPDDWILAEKYINPYMPWRDTGDERTGNVHPSAVVQRYYRIKAYMWETSEAGQADGVSMPLPMNDSLWDVQAIDTVGLCGEYCSAAIGPAGEFFVSSFANGNLKVSYASVVNDATVWSSEIVDADPVVGEYSSITVQGNGEPAISYFDAVNKDLRAAVRTNGIWEIYLVDGEGRSGLQTSMATAQDGHPAAAYCRSRFVEGSSVRELRYARFSGTSWETETVVSDSVNIDNVVSLKFAPDGNPAIVFSSNGFEVKYAKYDGVVWSIEGIDDEISGGTDVSLGFASDGNPSIAYHSWKNNVTGTSYDLRYAHFNGTEWDVEDVDVDGWLSRDTGYHTCLAFGPDGYPAISYHEWGNSGCLRFARYDGIQWQLETVDTEGWAGYYTTLVFDSDNRANIFYCDVENDYLKWAREAATSSESDSVEIDSR